MSNKSLPPEWGTNNTSSPKSSTPWGSPATQNATSPQNESNDSHNSAKTPATQTTHHTGGDKPASGNAPSESLTGGLHPTLKFVLIGLIALLLVGAGIFIGYSVIKPSLNEDSMRSDRTTTTAGSIAETSTHSTTTTTVAEYAISETAITVSATTMSDAETTDSSTAIETTFTTTTEQSTSLTQSTTLTSELEPPDPFSLCTGYWYVGDDIENECIIHSVSKESVEFSLWGYRVYNYDNILGMNVGETASDRTYQFRTTQDGALLYGTIVICPNWVTLDIYSSKTKRSAHMEYTVHRESSVLNGPITEETCMRNYRPCSLTGCVHTGNGNLNVRDIPWITGNKIGSLRDGTNFIITGATDDWYEIEFDGHTGYVSADYVIILEN